LTTSWRISDKGLQCYTVCTLS